jgi:hypothetical protein
MTVVLTDINVTLAKSTYVRTIGPTTALQIL